MRSLAALLLALALPAQAAVEAQDPPARVGRIAWTQGEVAAWLDPDRGWEKAYVNTPLTSENSLWTEPGARAELRIGSTALRLDAATQLDLRRLDEETLRAHVVRGSLAVRIRHFDRGEHYAVSTPHARFLLAANGRYRIDADDRRAESGLTVFSGSAQLEASGRRVDVGAGEAVRVLGEGGDFDFERAATTAFDDWALARDERLSDRQAARHVSPRMTGYEDLDEHGDWAVEPDYGTVWYPTRVAVDWVPYRHGHWAWHRPWGWTWIDYAPWGYAPFHYGRWVHVRDRWGWCPGRYVARPVWAPALVGWVGSPGWSVTIGSRTAPVVGWYPLAPWDRYQPWYTSNATHIHNVNVIVVNRPPGRDHRDRDYRDRDHNRIRGATVVPREGFVSQRPVHNTLAPVSGAALAALPVVSGASVLPTRAEIARPKPLQLSTPPATPRPAPPVGGDLVGTPANRSATRPPVGGPVAVEPRPRPAPQRLPPAVEPVTKPTAPAQSAPAPYAPTVRAKPVPQSIAPEPRANPAPAPAASPARPVEKPVARPTREEGRDKPDKPDKPDVDPTPVQKPGRGTQQR